ncbi:MBL fold metallo-hydrolase [Amycolatopsis sp. WQ 127309]|uniref:MBL fold metallo-hydrolase n=1 Tax=Amycolatopsis sp. WQ 127309 TaxID=2932773 RepID=UPI001FF327CF|nr:MBL fold metallo-hydrolase [Amycolatopsis sp. WQ 127309]UOZ07923.1 MBL fold metallo-hydrolase [Amycolatopsis sp. WQ 127309]
MHRITVGDYTVEALTDGLCRIPIPFFPGLDPAEHPEVLDPDGTVHVPIGAFLVRGQGRTILVDTGFGPRETGFPHGVTPAAGDPTPPMGEGGDLLAALAKAGTAPEDVDTVFVTHLHSDHMGWLAPESTPAFARVGLEAVHTAGSIEAIHGEAVPLAPGVTARHAPGHTPGHYVLDVEADDERLILLGDVIHAPVQLRDDRIHFIADHDPTEAARTRRRWLDEAERTSAVIAPAHFPGLEFLRLGPGRTPVAVQGFTSQTR